MGPSELAVRVMKHSKMLPTAISKMRAARQHNSSYESSTVQTRNFHYDNLDILFEKISLKLEIISGLGFRRY